MPETQHPSNFTTDDVSAAAIRAGGALAQQLSMAVETDGARRVVTPSLSSQRDSIAMKRDLILVTVAPVVDTLINAAGDNIGGKLTVPGVYLGVGVPARLQGLFILDKSNQKAALDLVIWDRDPAAATITTNAALVWGTTDVQAIARVPIAAADYVTIGAEAIACLRDLNTEVWSGTETTLYAALFTSGTPTYATAAALQLRLMFQRD